MFDSPSIPHYPLHSCLYHNPLRTSSYLFALSITVVSMILSSDRSWGLNFLNYVIFLVTVSFLEASSFLDFAYVF